MKTLDLSWINTLSSLPSWLPPLPSPHPQLHPSTFDNPPVSPEQSDINESHQGVKRHSSHLPSTDLDPLHHSNQTKEWVCLSLPNLPPHPLLQEQSTPSDQYHMPSPNNIRKHHTQSHALLPSLQLWILSQSRTSILLMFNFQNLNRWLLQQHPMGSWVDS